jgi:pyruvate formate lyase activating enzyme
MNGQSAMYFEKLEDKGVLCTLCPHSCRINPGRRGICGVRENVDGLLLPNSYGQITSIALDPIEKKPLARFHPGSMILSVGSYGCNFKCSFCQNHGISMNRPETIYLTPEALVEKALSLIPRGNIGIAYTYNEPLISFEYVYETSRQAREKGLRNVLVTNGYINEAPLQALLPFIDAMNIDLKSFRDEFYQKLCGGLTALVKRTIALASEACHVEITTLIIPGLNDSTREMDELSKWISELDESIPLHISRFFPRHRMLDREATPVDTILMLRDVASRHLRYVYTGNV